MGEQGHKRYLILTGGTPCPPPGATLYKFATNPMDTYLLEIQDAPGEIYDTEDLYEEDDNEEQSFNQFLNSNYDY